MMMNEDKSGSFRGADTSSSLTEQLLPTTSKPNLLDQESPPTDQCSLSEHLNTVACCDTQFELLASLSKDDQELIGLRANAVLLNDACICLAHKRAFLHTYPHNQRRCCDPLGRHKKIITQSLREISLDYYIELKRKGLRTIPGQKICLNCTKSMNTRKNIPVVEQELDHHQEMSQGTHTSQSDKESVTCNPQDSALDVCNEIFHKLGQSPIKMKGGRVNQMLKYGREKLGKLTEYFEGKIKKSLDLPSTCSLDIRPDVAEKAKHFDSLMTDLQKKISESSRSEQIRLLTIIPLEMSRKEVASTFKVSERLVRHSRELRRQEGILAVPKPRVGRPLEREVQDHVIHFYLDDLGTYSRVMPGMRDHVKISKNEYAQKRLMLCNLRELYCQFKIEFPDDKVGFSKFCAMRPKQCILPGANGTHSICVCTIHQNFKLLLKACGQDCSLTDFLSKIVCDIESKDCMFRLCAKCRRDSTSTDRLKKVLFPDVQEDDDEEDEQEYEYQEWLTTDRATLLTKRATRSELVDLLETKLDLLLPHAYIAKQQGNYLKMRKNELQGDEVLVQLDFSENYKYVVQDDISQRYWNQEAVTVHPVVIYLNDNQTVINKNMCFFTEDLKHDVSAVKVFIQKVFEYTIKEFPQVRKFEIFSDGCGGQYKNAEIFAFLGECEERFSINMKWNYFATSHGKSACDGIGGVIKRQAAIASLKRPHSNQILNVNELLKFCQENIRSVLCEHVSADEIDSVRSNVRKQVKTIPGTRSFHQFTVHNQQIVKCKHTSIDKNWALVFDLRGKVVKIWEASSHVAFAFNGNWHLGYIIQTSQEELIAEISVLSSNPSTKLYSFPEFPCLLTIAFPHIICNVKLTKKRNSPKSFTLSNAQKQKIEANFGKFSVDVPDL